MDIKKAIEYRKEDLEYNLKRINSYQEIIGSIDTEAIILQAIKGQDYIENGTTYVIKAEVELLKRVLEKLDNLEQQIKDKK